MSSEAPAQPANRQISKRLAIGLLLLPFVFGWALFRQGYSWGQRLGGAFVAAFGGAIWFVAVALVSVASMTPEEIAERDKRVEQRDAKREAEKIEEWSSDGSVATATRADFEKRGLVWPLTVDRARLGCTKMSRWVEVEGVAYGLNGTAKGNGYPAPDPVWQIDQRMAEMLKKAGAANETPVRVDIGDMLKEAGKLCQL